MSKIAVIYWSGTGNTQAMAEAVTEGAKAAGAEAELFTVDAITADAAAGYDKLALGCPAMGAEVLEEAEFEPFFTDLEGRLAPKPVAIFGSYGWGDDQWGCLDSLWQKESGWNHRAMNPSSGAYGIPQSLPGSKMATAGADWQTNPATQIRWGLGYIQGRYGSPCNAWAHSQANNWY